jgi:hypothetical protein
MDTIFSATTTSNNYNPHEATIVNIHNTLPKTNAERNTEYYKRTHSQGKKTFKQTFKRPKQQSGIGNTFHATMFLVVD